MNDLRVALATCAEHPGFIAGGNEALIPALAELGVAAEPAIWTDPSIDWSRYDAVVVRTTWHYTSRVTEFLAWMRHVESRTLLFNGSSLAEANLNKTYLKRLGEATVQTLWIEQQPNEESVDRALAEASSRGWSRVVLKPAIGAAAEGLLIADVEERDRLVSHARKIGGPCEVMVQPLLEGVRDRGELSLVYIDGVMSHAVRKTPTGGDYRCQIEFGGAYAVEQPSAPALERAACAKVLWTGEAAPLYARVDLVEPTPGDYRIIEVELVEPELFFRWSPAGARAFGEALRRRIRPGVSSGG